MPEITTWPDEVTIPFDGQVNLLAALVEGGIPITHLCGGKARCSTCRVKIAEGLSDLSQRTEKELAMAERLDFPDEIRLACQTIASESVSLGRLVLDKTDIALSTQIGKHAFTGPVGREVDVAVLFTDVVGYTTMADALPAYDIVHLLNRFFHNVSAEVVSHSGRVDNYMGDAVLALFGVDGEPKPALSAIRSGLGVLKIARDLSHYVERMYGMSFGVRVGVDYGKVVFGLMGVEPSARETAIGDTVNVASRLEAANKETGTSMLVTDIVFKNCGPDVDFGQSFDLDLRGKTGLVVAHEVIGLKNEDGI